MLDKGRGWSPGASQRGPLSLKEEISHSSDNLPDHLAREIREKITMCSLCQRCVGAIRQPTLLRCTFLLLSA